MKNKSKLKKIKEGKKPSLNLPLGWFLMCGRELSVLDIEKAVDEGIDVQVWTEARVAEIIIGEKSSIDIEQMDVDLGDDFSNEYLKEKKVASLFYVSFKPENYEAAKKVLKPMAQALDGFVCGDTEDFLPIM